MKSTVGVVIPVFNRRQVLLKTLEHAMSQNRLPTMLVIADDGSTDGTADAAEEFLTRRDPGFAWRVLRREHATAAAARNAGFELIKTLDYVAFLDSDDHWPHDFLSRGTTALDQDAKALAASTDRRYVSHTIDRQQTDCRSLAQSPIQWFFRYGAGVASCSLFRTAAISRAGGWNVALGTGEDAALFSQVALQGRWIHLPGDPVRFNINASDPDRQEEINLSRRHSNSHSRWASVYEKIYHQVCQLQPEFRRSPLRAALAYRWCAAGKQQMLLGDTLAAHQCFHRSLYWRPIQVKSYRRMARLVFSPSRKAA